MTLDQFLARLKNVGKSYGSGYVALCPAHEDSRRSLSVAQGTKGIVLRCFAGCSIDGICFALGIKVSELFNDSPLVSCEQQAMPCQPETSGSLRTAPLMGASSEASSNHSLVVARYDYVGEDGESIYQVRRYSDKSFTQHRSDGTPGIQGIRRVLYHLDKIQGKSTVYVCEGEKDVDNLWAIEIPATCCSGGSSGWRPEHVDQLVKAGVKQVVVLPDNDPPGLKYGHAVANACVAAGIQVKLVLLSGLKPSGDISDYLETHSRSNLATIVRSAISYEPSQSPDDLPPTVSTFESQPISWLWPGRIPFGKLTLFAGNAGEGKSFVSLDVAARLSIGLAWPDGAAGMSSQVIIFADEDDVNDTIRPRLEALGADLEKIRIVQPFKTEKGDRIFSLTEDLERLKSWVTQTGALLVIIDPINGYLGGKTDNYRDPEVRSVLGPITRMAKELKISLIGIMHLSKAVQTEVLFRIGGSVAFAALARAVFFVSHDPEDEGRRLFSCAKISNAAKADTRAFRILPSLKLEWEAGVVDITAQEAMQEVSQEKREGKKSVVVTWLQSVLSAGDKTQKEIVQMAEDEGFTRHMLLRAKAALKVKSRPGADDQGHIKEWVWSLPDA